MALWTDLTNQNKTGNSLPGANDSATIPAGATCNLSGASPTIQNLTVSGILTVASSLTIEGTPSSGTGITSVTGTGTLTIGNPSNPNDEASLDTQSFLDSGTTTVGGPSGGSSGTLDTVTFGSPTSSSTGVLSIGAPGSGQAGTVDVSQTMNIAGTLTVGGAGGSGGTLDVQSLTASAFQTVNSNGTIDVKNSAAISGTTTIAGGVINADNIDAYNGATVAFTGTVGITAGPLTGNLNAEENASFTFGTSASVTLGAGATLGDGKYMVLGALTVNTALDATKPEFTLAPTGAIGGSGSIDWWDNEFDWEGGTIGGLGGGGFTIDGQADFELTGASGKTLATTLINTGAGTADFDGTGTLSIDGSGAPLGTGSLLNKASAVLPMELSLPLMMSGAMGYGGTPGTFTNAGYLDIGGVGSAITISAALDNTAAGVIDCETGAGALTFSDTSGTSILDGKLGLNNDSLTISGLYSTDMGFEEEFSDSDSTTLTGTFTIDSGVSADFDHLILAAGSGSGGVITGAGDLSINDGGVDNGDYLKWLNGTIGAGGDFTIGTNATLYVMGLGTLDRNLDVEGTVECPSGAEFSFGSGIEVHVEKGGLFDFENSGGATISTFDNDGTLEVGAGDTLTIDTFTQSSTGTLQSNLASATSYGVVKVTGTATLDGTLDGDLAGGYQPPSGTSFDVLNFASSSGQFATIDPQGWSANYSSGSVDLVAG